MQKHSKIAFTFIEAILVIVILGIIAAITIGSIKMVNASQKSFETKAEKATSIIGQAFMMMFLKDSTSDDLYSLSDKDGAYTIETENGARFVRAFKKHLEISEVTEELTNTEYFDGNLYSYDKTSLGKLSDFYGNFFFLQDGMLFGFRFYESCEGTEANALPPGMKRLSMIGDVCGSIFVDVNGTAKPNKLGSDQIIIPFDREGIRLTNE